MAYKHLDAVMFSPVTRLNYFFSILLNDGLWFNALPDSKKNEIFTRDLCRDGIAQSKCTVLKKMLTDLYADKRNLRIPYAEALYIVSLQDKNASSSQIELEITCARQDMADYYALVDKPNLYLTYDSLVALKNDIDNNTLKRDRIIKPLEATDSPVITIKSAAVQSVAKIRRWDGVIVMTYQRLENNGVVFGAVYVSSDDLKDDKTHEFIENLKRDDVVQIIGSAYSTDRHTDAGIDSEAIRFFGGVHPVSALK